jgi:hypothetical protein
MKKALTVILAWTVPLLAFSFPAISPVIDSNAGNDWKKKYRSISEFGDVYVVKSVYSFCNEYDTWLADKNGRLLTPAYRDIGPFSDGRAEFVPKEGRCQLMPATRIALKCCFGGITASL